MMSAAETPQTLPPHPEKLIGLLYVCSGKAVIQEEGGTGVLAAAGSALLFPCWKQQDLTFREDTSLLLCGFRCDQPEETLSRHIQEHGLAQNCREHPDLQRLLSPLEAALPELMKTPSAQSAAQLLEHLLGVRDPQEIPAYLRTVRRLIDTRYAEDLTLDRIAEEIGRSKFHLSHMFREYYGMSLGGYLNFVRLNQAAHLLAATELSVQAVGRQVGFPNSTYFTALFKQRYGQPPRSYRNTMKK